MTNPLELWRLSLGRIDRYGNTYDVPESTYNDVRASASLGKAFNAMIKTNFREARIG